MGVARLEPAGSLNLLQIMVNDFEDDLSPSLLYCMSTREIKYCRCLNIWITETTSFMNESGSSLFWK